MPQRTDDPVISRTQLLAQGLSDHQIRRARERGELHSVLPGVYLRAVPDPEPDPDPARRHRATLTVVVPLLSGRPVVSHVSAAIMHGLPFCHSDLGWLGRPRRGEPGRFGDPRPGDARSLRGPGPDRPGRSGAPRADGIDRLGRPDPGGTPPMHVTRPDAAKSRRGATVQLHKAALDPAEVVELGGLPVTTPERTVVDCALTLPFDHAVMLADAALRRGLVSRPSLDRQLGRLHRVPGTRRAAEVVAFADPRSRGPGESISRVLMHRHGVPPPELDVPVTDAGGRPLGRMAFAFPDAGVLGEFVDGPPDVVPGRAAEPDAGPDDHAAALLAAGWRTVRWTWPDLRSPDPWLDRLRAALAPVRAPR
jgi:hypothetical protein